MNKIVLIVLAIVLPPLSVFLKKGVGMPLLINVILTLLLYVPGLIHALFIVMED